MPTDKGVIPMAGSAPKFGAEANRNTRSILIIIKFINPVKFALCLLNRH